MTYRPVPLLLAALLSLSDCQKDDPEAQLPSATQTGAGTFGCLVNGKAWTPQGDDGIDNFDVLYDPTFQGGTLQISAYRYVGAESSNKRTYMGVGAINVRAQGRYPITPTSDAGANFRDISQMTPCIRNTSTTSTIARGNLTLTRLDLQARIISGTFEFTLYKPGCDTIKVTQGRFDYKL